MCKAFSCIVDDHANVYWEFGVDSHTELMEHFHLPDKIADRKQLLYAKVEITPAKTDYLQPDKWILTIDEDIKPEATLVGDLGAESIDFLDIVFRLEKTFNINKSIICIF